MINIFAFSVTFLQLAVVAFSYFLGWNELFLLFIYYFSPITVFFSLMGTVIEFAGDFSFWSVAGLFYCFVKYFTISRAIAYDGISFWDAGAVLMEIIYLAASGLYIFYYSYYSSAVS